MQQQKINSTGRRLLITAAILFTANTLQAQSDFGIWYSADVSKKLSRQWSIEAEGEFRSRNDGRTADRFSLGASANYKLGKHVKFSLGYDFIRQNTPEKITLHTDGTYNNWRPSFWAPRHRLHFDAQGSMDVGRVKLSLRERWQYTYRPRATTTRYDFDNAYWEDTQVASKAKNVLRSRLAASWNTKHCPVDPFAHVELFNAWRLTKVRYTVGADWKLTKQHALSLFYRYQNVNNDDENQPNEHILGVGYTFKF